MKVVNSQGSPGGGIVACQLRVASDPWEADPLIWDHQLRVPGQFIFRIIRISTQTSWNKSLHLLAVSNDSLDHLSMQNHYNNGINFKNQMCQIFTYFVEKGMVALEDDEAVRIPEKTRLSMLNLAQPIIAGALCASEHSKMVEAAKWLRHQDEKQAFLEM